ncbi:MAG: hypothetical protein JW928_01205 [Candidatus Aureabacteria bacterium]|nr:hypothetical protein [Candidatus Auribacterota bacterium]
MHFKKICISLCFGFSILILSDCGFALDITSTLQSEDIVLQYRISRDATVPSSFIVVYPGGLLLSLKIVWDISAEEKEKLEKIIERLEEKEINGASFHCRGCWIKKGYEIRIFHIEPSPDIMEILSQ